MRFGEDVRTGGSGCTAVSTLSAVSALSAGTAVSAFPAVSADLWMLRAGSMWLLEKSSG
jgi:hypothetical protein